MLFVKLDTGFNIEVEFPVCPFHKRLFAWIVDLILCWLYVKLMAVIFDIPSFFIWISEMKVKGALISLPVLFYHLYCEIILNGQSIGKMVMGIKVITIEGGQPGFGQYLIRWIFRLFDFPLLLIAAVATNELAWWLFPVVFTGLFCVIFSKRSQRIGDLVAGTMLIDLRNRTSWEDTVFLELEANYQPLYPQVMQLSDRDINTLKSIIETVQRKGDYELSMRIADRIKSKLKMDSDQNSLDFLQTLLKDYNYYSTRI
ncbi:MAG TPA: RDD family protein [Flavitalea sp.]|nr:RDD family protein [Flavitalea sp.]